MSCLSFLKTLTQWLYSCLPVWVGLGAACGMLAPTCFCAAISLFLVSWGSWYLGVWGVPSEFVTVYLFVSGLPYGLSRLLLCLLSMYLGLLLLLVLLRLDGLRPWLVFSLPRLLYLVWDLLLFELFLLCFFFFFLLTTVYPSVSPVFSSVVGTCVEVMLSNVQRYSPVGILLVNNTIMTIATTTATRTVQRYIPY